MFERYSVTLDEDERQYLLKKSTNGATRNTTEHGCLDILNDCPKTLASVRECLDLYVEKPERFNFYLVKSWGTFLPKDGMGETVVHNHAYAHLSFVIYLQKDEKGGNPIFVENNIRKPFHVEEGQLIIFPAWVPHCVEPNESTTQRYSVAGDILMVLKDQYADVNFLTPVETWLCL